MSLTVDEQRELDVLESEFGDQPSIGEPLDPDVAFDRAGKVWDTSVAENVPLHVADQYFYDAQPVDPSDFSKPIPDNRVGFSEEFLHQWTGKNAVTKIPIVGGVAGAAFNMGTINAANRLTDPVFDYDLYNDRQTKLAATSGFGAGAVGFFDRPNATVTPAVKEKDQQIIADAIKEFEFQSRGKTFLGKVAAGVSQLPTWMLEFAATGGLASLGDDVAQKVGEKLLRKHVKTTAGKIAMKSAGLVTGAVVRTSTGLLPRVGEKATERQVLIEIGVASEEGWGKSLAKAWGEIVIESATEESGKFISAGASKFAGKYMPRLRDVWIALTGKTADDFATKMLTKAGYSNILTEFTEEEIATILRGVTGVSDTAGNPGQRVWKDLKTDFELSNLGSKIVTIAAPAFARRGFTIGASLTEGVRVPSDGEQLNQAIAADKVTFDTPQEAEAFAEDVARVAQREGKDVTVKTDFADNSVRVEEVEDISPLTGEPIRPLKKPKVTPPAVAEKQKLPDNESVTPVEKDIIGVEPIDKVREALKKAKAVAPLVKSEQREERAKRFAAATEQLKTDVKNGMPIEEAVFRSTGQLKGALTEYSRRFESIEEQLTAEEKEALYGKILDHKGISYPEVLNANTALKKLLAGAALTDSNIRDLESVFGKSFVDESGTDLLESRREVSSIFDRAIALWKAGLLTGPKTQGLNFLANMTHAVTETAKDIPAALVDKTVSLYTGERTLAFTTKGTVAGIKKGLVDGWKYLKTGHSERDIGKKLDHTKVNFGTGKLARALQTYEETVFHLLGAADQPFYYGAKARSIASQAIAQGKNKGLKGKELDAFVDKLIQNPTDDILVASVLDAEVAVFQNRTALGDIAKSIQKTKVGEVIVPFGRTPSAVATQIINYTPVGPIKEIAEQINDGEFNQRKFSQAFGRGAVGTGVLWIGGQLLTAGLMTLDRPRNERERRLWELEGRKANSIKIDGKWRSIQVLGPAGNVLIIGGHFSNELSKEGSPTVAIGKALSGSAKSFSEQTFVQGVNRAVDALVSPERSFENWFSSMAGSVVPTIVADIARASTEKEVRVDGAIQRVQSRVPGLRGKLPSKIDVFGQDLPRYGGNVLEVMIDPTRPAKIRNDVVVDEIRRLADNKLEVTPTLLGGKDGFDVLTAEENTELWRRAGELTYKTLQALVTSDGYAKINNDFAKSKMIEEVVKKTRAAARAEASSIKLSQGVGIVELAESGLLSVEEIEAIKFFGAK